MNMAIEILSFIEQLIFYLDQDYKRGVHSIYFIWLNTYSCMIREECTNYAEEYTDLENAMRTFSCIAPMKNALDNLKFTNFKGLPFIFFFPSFSSFPFPR